MLLSGYRNPPFKPPTPKPASRDDHHHQQQQQQQQHSPATRDGNLSTSLSPRPRSLPPGARSPKRRTPDDEVSDSGADSPRTKAAERFQNLGLHAPPLPGPQSSWQSPRKKIKLGDGNPGLPQRWRFGELEIRDSVGSRFEAEMNVEEEEEEIPESPLGVVSASFHDHDDDELGSTPPSTSSPLPNPSQPSPNAALPPDPSSSYPALPPASENEDIDLAALTWQDDEITGHNIDTSTPDDDGEGINGIGFRPTPAMAYARSQKRRQQVSEWRSREAREARQRRIERRRGALASGEGAARRVVRFAGVGQNVVR